MKTLAINIPDGKINEGLSVLNQLGVKVISSKPSEIDKFKKGDCQEHLLLQAPSNNEELFDETGYLLKRPANAARLLESIKAYEKSTSMKENN